jgi:hypothetical protein
MEWKQMAGTLAGYREHLRYLAGFGIPERGAFLLFQEYFLNCKCKRKWLL